jgi:hypothetical protein
MEFIKRNYEKIILSLVLLGLVGALAFMPVVIFYDQQQMTDAKNNVTHPHVVPLSPLDLSREDTVLDRLKSPYDLDFSTTNKLFNPVQWQKDKNGALIKITTGHETGPGAAVIAKITPLYFLITLDSVMTNELGERYALSIEDQSAAIPVQRRKRPHFASKGKGNDTVVDKSVGGKNEGFTLVDVKGPPENPDQLVLKLADTGAEVTLSKDNPFRRVDAYSADLKYDLDKPPYSGMGLRVGDHLAFAGDDYNVIAIDESGVILLSLSNQKKYTLRYAP